MLGRRRRRAPGLRRVRRKLVGHRLNFLGWNHLFVRAMGAPTGRGGGKGGGKAEKGGGKGADKGGGKGGGKGSDKGSGKGAAVPLGVGGRGRGSASNQPPRAQKQKSGEPFAEPITFAGRSDDFLIAKDTYISCMLYEAFHVPSELVEGAVVHGLRVLNEGKGSSKWRATRVERIDAPSPTERRNASRGAHRGGGGSPTSGEPFDDVVTYAGRAEQFIICRDTFVPSQIFAAWRPIFEGDRLIGRRVLNSGGSSKWRAVCISAVRRAEGPTLSPHEAWLERSHALLARVHASDTSAGAPSADADESPTGGAPDDSTAGAATTHAEAEKRAAAAKAEAMILLDLADLEWQAMSAAQPSHKKSATHVPAPAHEEAARVDASAGNQKGKALAAPAHTEGEAPPPAPNGAQYLY